MSLWISNDSMMRPETPTWLEEMCDRLSSNDPMVTVLELTHYRINDHEACLLAESLKHNTSVTVMVLSCYTILDQGATALSSWFRTSTSLRVLQFRDLRKSREVVSFCKAIASNSSIEELSFRHCTVDCHGGRYLYDLIENGDSIQEMRFVDTDFLGGSLCQVCKGIEMSQSLKKVYFVNVVNEITVEDDTLTNMLRSNTSMTELHLSENGLGNKGVAAVVAGLLNNSTLQVLDLRSNDIGKKGAESLATLLRSNGTLTTISLGSNVLGDDSESIRVLAEALSASRIQRLDLSNNSITVEGSHILANKLAQNQVLQDLNLSFNNGIGDQGACAMAEMLTTNSMLQSLSMRRCNISNEGLTSFSKKLPLMTGLKELSMSRNPIDGKACSSLLQGIRLNVELQSLHMDSAIGETTIQEIKHWLELNQAGRRVFKQKEIDLSLWPLVLSRSSSNPEALSFFLREKPYIVQSTSTS